MRLCVLVFLLLVLAALLLLGLFLLIPFPLAVYPAVVKSQVYIQHKKDGQFPKATAYWAKLPAIQYYDFYFFNVTNPDEILYNGEMPTLVEIGPYSYAETEFKEDIEFYDGDEAVYYKNNKSWEFSSSTSCSSCGFNDVLTLPNAAYMSVLYLQKYSGIPSALSKILDIVLILLGEQPISTVTMKGVTFEGYDDPLIDLVNSNFTADLLGLLGHKVEQPLLPPMGYFPKYSPMSDGDYDSLTGKDNTDNLGLIQRWCNESHLRWWGDDYSQDISGSGDGSFQKPFLKKTDRLKQFQSFICRSFYLHYDSQVTVNGNDAYRFKMDDDTYDTTTELNKGYRYENKEMVDFFPSWPCGNNHTYAPDFPQCAGVDCGLRQNWCSMCCNGTHYTNGTESTIFFPPGIIPLRCRPGQNVSLPFAGFLSPPHFAWSPPEVYNSMYGLHPDPDGKHHPGTFEIQPTTGSTVGGRFRMQLSIPIYKDSGYTGLCQTKNNFLPSFWLEVRVAMYDYARNYIHFNTKTLPQILLGVGIGLTAVACIGFVLLIICWIRMKRKTTTAKNSSGSDIWTS